LNAQGKFDNLQSVNNEVKLMMDPNADPFAAASIDPNAVPSKLVLAMCAKFGSVVVKCLYL
jgi:hypothetical protein